VRGSPGKEAAAVAAIEKAAAANATKKAAADKKKAAAGQKPNKRGGQIKRISKIFNSSKYVIINFHHIHSAYQVLLTTE
jgi:hypothetical protein